MIAPLELLEVVVANLGEFTNEVVFVGGAIVPLLITDPAAPEVGATQDVDIIISVASHYAYTHVFGDRLRQLGFTEDSEENAPICRFRHRSGAKLDMMPTDPSILGFSNRWFDLAYATAQMHHLPSGRTIKAATAPCFLATKLEAFSSRGKGDYYASKDIEDFIAVIHGRRELLEEAPKAPPELRCYLARQATALLNQSDLGQILEGHLPGEDIDRPRTRLRDLACIA